jgi:hypothetical protein
VPLHTALQAASHYTASQNRPEVAALLEDLAKNVGASAAELEGKIKEVDGRISHVFDSLPRDELYSLFAVLVHDGKQAGQGHYWTYVRDLTTGRWLKYNDAKVSHVEQEVGSSAA